MSASYLDLSPIARPSGGLAMLAIDQREALRNMFVAAGWKGPVSDSVLTDFKVALAHELAPAASAVLVDRQFSLDAVIADGTVIKDSSLIVAADEFVPGNGIPVDSVGIDTAVDPHQAAIAGARALKLLVLWRSDEPAAERLDLVRRFVRRSHDAGLIAIIEPVVRPPRHGADFDREKAILCAAEELGATGADLYKGEMPLGGRGSDADLLNACKRLDDRLDTPWVILSSGVETDLFPNAVRQAVRGGARGFLAGRAVWSSLVGRGNTAQLAQDISLPRLRRLGEIVDEELARQ